MEEIPKRFHKEFGNVSISAFEFPKTFSKKYGNPLRHCRIFELQNHLLQNLNFSRTYWCGRVTLTARPHIAFATHQWRP
jgi:hypothetical protein